MSTLQEVASQEAHRAVRSGRWFSLLRVAPPGWVALDSDMEQVLALVRAYVRRTDAVVRVRDREVGVVLVETVGHEVNVPVERLRDAFAVHVPWLELRIGWASVGPGQRPTWQDAWRWAGQLLVAAAAVPAAA
jgi:hypothetical protein